MSGTGGDWRADLNGAPAVPNESGPRRTCSQGPRSSALSAAAPFVCMKRAELLGPGASTSYTTETSQPLHHQSSPFALAGEGCDTIGVLPPDPIPPARAPCLANTHTHARTEWVNWTWLQSSMRTGRPYHPLTVAPLLRLASGRSAGNNRLDKIN